jgi:hypothetical protein
LGVVSSLPAFITRLLWDVDPTSVDAHAIAGRGATKDFWDLEMLLEHGADRPSRASQASA